MRKLLLFLLLAVPAFGQRIYIGELPIPTAAGQCIVSTGTNGYTNGACATSTITVTPGVSFSEEFCGGLNTTGQLGELGWTFNGGGGSTTQIQSGIVSANNPCQWEVASGSNANQWEWLVLGKNNTGGVFLNPASKPHIMNWIAQIQSLGAGQDFTLRLGWTQDSGNQNPANGIYFEAAVINGAANWHCVTRAASVETSTDSSTALGSNFTRYTITSDGTNITFYINGTQVCQQSTNFPTGLNEPGVEVTNVAANNATRRFWIDYFNLSMTLSR